MCTLVRVKFFGFLEETGVKGNVITTETIYEPILEEDEYSSDVFVDSKEETKRKGV